MNLRVRLVAVLFLLFFQTLPFQSAAQAAAGEVAINGRPACPSGAEAATTRCLRVDRAIDPVAQGLKQWARADLAGASEALPSPGSMDAIAPAETWEISPISGNFTMRVPATAIPAEGSGAAAFFAARPKSGGVQPAKNLATYITAAITKPSPGQFNYLNEKVWQSSGTGWGKAAEYRMKIRGNNYGGLLFSDTPTNGTLYVPGQKPFSWPVRRYEFDMLWTHEFEPLWRRAAPYVTSGAGAIALNGGPTESGWDKQGALVTGAGSDIRLARFVTMRVGFTLDWLKASTYSDRTYRASGTVMAEPRIGFVWGLGMPRPR